MKKPLILLLFLLLPACASNRKVIKDNESVNNQARQNITDYDLEVVNCSCDFDYNRYTFMQEMSFDNEH